MIDEKINLDGIGYTIRNDVLAKYPDFKLICMLDEHGYVVDAEAAFSPNDPAEIIYNMLSDLQSTEQAHVIMSRVKMIGFNEAMEKAGFGIRSKNYPILHALVELGFLTKDEVQNA